MWRRPRRHAPIDLRAPPQRECHDQLCGAACETTNTRNRSGRPRQFGVAQESRANGFDFLCYHLPVAADEPEKFDFKKFDLGDLFSQFFASANIAVTLELTDAQAAAGLTQEVAVTRTILCLSCDGTGNTEPESSPVKCTSCEGKGQCSQTQGFFNLMTSCTACRGVGVIIRNPCKRCDGRGMRPDEAKVSVEIPPGVKHEQTIVMKRAGSSSRDGTQGDLFVYLLVGGRPDSRDAAFGVHPDSNQLPRATIHNAKAPPDGTLVPLGALLAAVVIIIALLAAR